MRAPRGKIPAIVVGSLSAGLVLHQIPPELLIYTLGAGFGTVASAVGLYLGSSRVRQAAWQLSERVDRLLNPPPASRKALPVPPAIRQLAARDTEDMQRLEQLLTADIEPPPPPPAPAATRPLARTEAPTIAHVQPAAPAPASASIAITYHPELRERWAEYAEAAQLDRRAPLRLPASQLLAELAVALGAVQARVAASAADGQGTGPLLALAVLQEPISHLQRVTLDGWGGWWQEYRNGRVRGVLLALAGEVVADVATGDDAAGNDESRLTYADLDAIDARSAGSGFDEPDEPEAPPTMVYRAAPTLAYARPASPPPPAEPAHPMPRLVGDGAIKTIEVAVGKLANGRWAYAPLRMGLLANSTGGGKTNIMDLIIGQIQALGDQVDVWYGTAKPFVVIDPTDGLDRRPLIDRLDPRQKALNADDILAWLWAVADKVKENYERMQREPGWFPRPMVILFDETKAYFAMMENRMAKFPGETRQWKITDLAARRLGELVFTARESGACLIMTSQDGYCGSVKLTRGDMRNLGFRMIHPGLDSNSLSNVLPEGMPSLLRPRKWQWVLAANGQVQLVDVPRVSVEMMHAWGLLETAAPQDSSDSNPDVDDTELLRWVLSRTRRGDSFSVQEAAVVFGVSEPTMREALTRNGLLE